MRKVVLSIGGNLGDRLEVLKSALMSVGNLQGVTVSAVSSVYETDPWGPVKQGDFLNAILVLQVLDEVKPLDLLADLHRVENEHGRVREIRYGPRTLDIDIVVFGELRSDLPELTLPHPFAHERAFVLTPWAEVEPEAVLQPYGPISRLMESLDSTSVRLRGDLRLR